MAVAAPEFSPWLYRGFVLYLRRYFANNFDAVRTSGARDLAAGDGRPLIVYANHPSWWDPIHFLLLAHHRLPGVRICGPMDADALEKYRFFKRLGAFGVDRGSRQALATFVRTSLAVLARPDSSLWLTAGGEFADARRRPVTILPGIAHLVRKIDRVRVVPVAVEYPFWNERRPEALSRFGTPIDIDDGAMRSVQEWAAIFGDCLRQTMDRLAADAQGRSPERFTTLIRGRSGISGIYDAWRRARAWSRGESFSAAHDELAR